MEDSPMRLHRIRHHHRLRGTSRFSYSIQHQYGSPMRSERTCCYPEVQLCQ